MRSIDELQLARRIARPPVPACDFLLVGEAPAPDASRAHLEVMLALKAARSPLANGKVAIARDLAWLHTNARGLFGFVERTRHVNVLEEWPGAGRKGSKFPLTDARHAAAALLDELADDPPRVVLLAGARVAHSFNLRPGRWSYFSTAMRSPETEFVVVPHPSGVNRWWNQRLNAASAAAYLERLGAS